MWKRHIDHLRTAVTKSGVCESEIDDEQMTQSAKKEEKRTALESTERAGHDKRGEGNRWKNGNS